MLHLDPTAQISLVHTIPALHARQPYIMANITVLTIDVSGSRCVQFVVLFCELPVMQISLNEASDGNENENQNVYSYGYFCNQD